MTTQETAPSAEEPRVPIELTGAEVGILLRALAHVSQKDAKRGLCKAVGESKALSNKLFGALNTACGGTSDLPESEERT